MKGRLCVICREHVIAGWWFCDACLKDLDKYECDCDECKKDFLDEVIEERTAANPDFLKLLEDAESNRAIPRFVGDPDKEIERRKAMGEWDED